MTSPPRYVARAEAGKGWRIWNRKSKKFWGNPFLDYPDALLAELNGPARPEVIVELVKNRTNRTD